MSEVEQLTMQRDAWRSLAGKYEVALHLVSGALVDAGTIQVPSEVSKYGEAIRELIKERDALKEWPAEMAKVSGLGLEATAKETADFVVEASNTLVAFLNRKEKPHVDSKDCWCSPRLDYRTADGVEVWVHNRVQ